MSSAERAARRLKDLEQEDFEVLQAFEKALTTHEFVPIKLLAKLSSKHEEEVQYRLSRLAKNELIMSSPFGYVLVSTGLDAIALKALVERELVSAFGKSIGIGKESDVFEAIDDQGSVYALKLYRIGRTSFRDTSRKRGYVTPVRQHHWLFVNIQAAKREYDAIRLLHPLGVKVPRAIARERHALLLRRVDGVRLADCKALENPIRTLGGILKDLRTAYLKEGLVNADLSEFNILYDGKKPWIIDWPQCVTKEHPNASVLLDRDLLNILKFFKRRFGVEMVFESVSMYVKGRSKRLRV